MFKLLPELLDEILGYAELLLKLLSLLLDGLLSDLAGAVDRGLLESAHGLSRGYALIGKAQVFTADVAAGPGLRQHDTLVIDDSTP